MNKIKKFKFIFNYKTPNNAKKIIPLMGNIAIGFMLKKASSLSNISILHYDEFLKVKKNILNINGVICSNEEQFMQISELCEKLNITTCIIDQAEYYDFANKLVVIDCNNSCFFNLNDLTTVEKKRLIFDWARYMSLCQCNKFKEEKKLEGVITNQKIVYYLWNKLNLNKSEEKTDFIQNIYPYDFPDRIYCGVSARIQENKDSCRLQFKYAQVLNENNYRFDHEVHLDINSKEEGDNLLLNLGYKPRPSQQRLIDRYYILDVMIQFNYWPGANGIYVGIEAQSKKSIDNALEILGIANEYLESIDGIDLFKKFNISLNNCLFEKNSGVFMNEMINICNSNIESFRLL